MPGEELAGLPELPVAGLRDDDARALLGSALPGPLDERVRDQIVAEARGNPLALLELPRGLTPAQLAGGFGLPGAVPLSGRIEESFRRQLDALPAPDPAAAAAGGGGSVRRPGAGVAGGRAAGDPVPGGGAGGRGGAGGVRRAGAVPASAAALGGLPVGLGSRTGRPCTSALAEATDPAADPDRRAWHRAQAAPGPDEEVAAELERSAGRAQARGGLAAAAAFLERAVALTADPARRARAHAGGGAGQARRRARSTRPSSCSATAEAGPLDELASARVDLLRGQVAFASGRGSDAPPLLLKAAKRLEPLDPELARETYLTPGWRRCSPGAWPAAADLLEVSPRRPAAPPPPDPPRPVDLVLDGLALLVTDGHAAAAPALRRAAQRLRAARHLRRGRSGGAGSRMAAASALWDDEAWRAMLGRQVELARDAARSTSCRSAGRAGHGRVSSGDFAEAAALIAEARAVSEATGSRVAPLHRHDARGLRGPGGRGHRADRGRHAEAAAAGEGIARRRTRTGRRRSSTTASAATPRRWPRPGRPARTPRALRLHVGAARADRGGRAQPGNRARWPATRSSGSAEMTQRRRHRLGARDRGALAGAAERGRGRRGLLPRGDRPARPHPRSAPNWPARTSSTASGCAARTAAWTPASSCAPRTRC